MAEGKTDLRVVRTRAAIDRAFEELVCEVGLDKVTVKDLAERAGINRKTFYLSESSESCGSYTYLELR